MAVFGSQEGIPNCKEPYLGLGGMWCKNDLIGLLLVPMGSPQAPQIKVVGFLMGTLFKEITYFFCYGKCTSEFKDVRIR